MEIAKILRLHAARYPKMEPRDAVKLLYQNEFGGGHLIRDPEECREYLTREHAATAPEASAPFWESIGNGFVRVNLAAVSAEELPALYDAFLRSARTARGSRLRFLRKLRVLRRLAARGVFSFTLEEADAYLTEYLEADCPMVSHSEAYREAYRPAYRVVAAKYLPPRQKAAEGGEVTEA